MTAHVTADPTPRKPLRLWPGLALAAVLLLFKVYVHFAGPGAPPFVLLGALVVGALILLWFTFFSRATRTERFGGLALLVVAMLVTQRFLHPSLGEAGNGMLFPVVGLPYIALTLVAWAAVAGGLGDRTRRAALAATILVASGVWALLRTGGITGQGSSDLQWRWSQTAEERLLAEAGDDPGAPAPPLPPPSPAASIVPPAAPTSAPGPAASASAPAPAGVASPPPSVRPSPAMPRAAAEWPGFRGPRRDSVIPGVRIDTDWAASPPAEMWRRKVGPGWSSFAVDGDLLFTQEQRGEHEVVSAYRVSTGQPVWSHRDRARFWESNGGAGPRGTPAVHDGRVYTFGATGILNALDARTGAVVWTRNPPADVGVKNPGWGFSSSPLVVDDVLIVAAGGTLAAYDLQTGAPRWSGPKRPSDYSSPHLATLRGVRQVLLLNGKGLVSVAPADGKLLWEHALTPGSRIIQPALTSDGDVLATNGAYGDGNGTRRIAVTQGPSGWTTQERWSSGSMKPNFNDFVVNDGHLFGFDGSILACVDLADGTRKWKGGRYGNGQVVLLADQDLLVVLSEEGELALVGATTDGFRELGRFKALEGKTWNHPVLVRDVLLVRNGEEMAAFRLKTAPASASR